MKFTNVVSLLVAAPAFVSSLDKPGLRQRYLQSPSDNGQFEMVDGVAAFNGASTPIEGGTGNHPISEIRFKFEHNNITAATNSTVFRAPLNSTLRGLQSSCGNGNVGNGVCPGGLCCSQWGWCGSSSAHCSGNSAPTGPSPTPPSSGGTCGGGSRGNGVCADGQCCSQYGWCGTTSAHCTGASPSPPAGPSPTPPSLSSGTCGGGSQGNGVCANGQCCSQYGWCGTTSAHCAGTSPSPPTGPSPTPPTGGGLVAYATYHSYSPNFPLTGVSCSDGSAGLITRWGYQDVSPMWPYLTATSNVAGWGSPNCGVCYAVSSGGRTIYVTAVDASGPWNGGPHFDLAPPAFDELLGATGIQNGGGSVTFAAVASRLCRGNLG